ncbi:hypothetical protein GJ496_002955 [Pomphorhynchus laevis]|nr:hypothetical protein GJ496_002955 [Pomphorhynchus laevis]
MNSKLVSSSDNDFDNERSPEPSSPLLSIFFDNDDMDVIEENNTVRPFSTADNSDIFGESLSDISADESMEHSDLTAKRVENENSIHRFGSPFNEQFENDRKVLDKSDENWVVKLKIPRIKINTGRELHFVKLPPFLNIDSRPFDPSCYVHEDGSLEDMDELERKRLRLKIENTVRWRAVENGGAIPVKQSNARFVQWSDGSLSFYIGDKVFDVFKNNIINDHNHLFVRHGSYLHGQVGFRTKLTFRPYSTEVNATSRISASIARKPFSSNQKIRILSHAGQNPDINRIELIKQEEKRLKREDRRRNLLEKRKEDARHNARRQLNSRFLERDDDTDDEDDIDETRDGFESDIDAGASDRGSDTDANVTNKRLDHQADDGKGTMEEGSDEDVSSSRRNRKIVTRIYSSSDYDDEDSNKD